jgi:hypothetical protein
MDYNFYIGVIGSIILVIGSAWPAQKVKHPVYSKKNWLFAVGNLFMFIFAVLGYLSGGSIFFIFLQILIAISTIMMMMDVAEKHVIPVISVSGLLLILWSLYLFEDYNTIFFILGLTVLALGFSLNTGTTHRNIALSLGSILIAVFSYIEMNWVFFWLNAFFAVFSGYYAIKLSMIKKTAP